MKHRNKRPKHSRRKAKLTYSRNPATWRPCRETSDILEAELAMRYARIADADWFADAYADGAMDAAQ
jgi:hypothetical protein